MAAGTGFLTTHILDTANGRPACGVKVDLYRLTDITREHLVAMVTNGDGRTDRPIIAQGELIVGTYELVFSIGDYFAGDGQKPANPFIDVVPIRFGIAEPDEHYHVPLLASPFSFSTYRGS